MSISKQVSRTKRHF